MVDRLPLAAILLLPLALAACAGTSTTAGDVPINELSGMGSSNLVIPNAPAGDAVARGVEQPRSAQRQLTAEQARAIYQQRMCAAERLWNQAESIEAKNPGGAAELYETIFDDYPEYEKAAEAKFREGRARTAIRDCEDAAAALKEYMRIAPVNPHLAEVEELLFQSGKCGLAQNTGLLSVFRTDDASLAALKFVAEAFPTGEFADDSLLLLGDYYRADEDYATAALTYKELLVRYPDSEWSFKARLKLADTYLARDRGCPYDAGFIVVDPRELIPAEQAKMTAPIESAVELALEQYEIYLERMEADPARMAEYCQDVEYARRMRQRCREDLAGKDVFRGDWYLGRSCVDGAIGFYREAQKWTGTQAAQSATAKLAALEGRRTPARTRTRTVSSPPPIRPAVTPAVTPTTMPTVTSPGASAVPPPVPTRTVMPPPGRVTTPSSMPPRMPPRTAPAGSVPPPPPPPPAPPERTITR